MQPSNFTQTNDLQARISALQQDNEMLERRLASTETHIQNLQRQHQQDLTMMDTWWKDELGHSQSDYRVLMEVNKRLEKEKSEAVAKMQEMINAQQAGLRQKDTAEAKTSMDPQSKEACRNFLRGKCTRAPGKCNFYHPTDPAEFEYHRTCLEMEGEVEMCRNFRIGECKEGRRCLYRHG